MVRPVRRGVSTWCALLVLGCGGVEGAPAGSTDGEAQGAQAVRPGIDVLLTDSLHLVQGLRIGLITNHTGVDAAARSSIDRLHEAPETELVALYSPEHGIRGTAEAGEHVDSGRDGATGLPVHSLYGDTRKPTPRSLDGVQALVFDIQDIGARYYTYVYTMALGMEAAGEADIPFVVLDRPNPIGGVQVQGNVLEPGFSSFVGMYPIPMRHGMTPGELATLFRGSFGVEVELHVVPVDGWRRAMAFAETGLPWRAPSPNMPDTESGLHYPGTCLFEGTNLSVGRGSERPFQQVGAPWLDGEALAASLNGLALPDTRFEPVEFTPTAPGDGKFDGQRLSGVRFRSTGPGYDPTRAAVAALVHARAQNADAWEWRPSHFDRLAGTAALRSGIEEGQDLETLTAGWTAQLEAFTDLRDPVLLYP